MKIANWFTSLSVLSVIALPRAQAVPQIQAQVGAPASVLEFWSHLTCSSEAAKLTVVGLPSGEAQITLVNPAGPAGQWKSAPQSPQVGFFSSVRFELDGVKEPLLIHQRKNFGRAGPIGEVTSASLGDLFLQCGYGVEF